MREQIQEALGELSDEREHRILELLFGFGDDQQHTLEYVADHFGITRERIRKIEAKALARLRKPSKKELLGDFLLGLCGLSSTAVFGQCQG